MPQHLPAADVQDSRVTVLRASPAELVRLAAVWSDCHLEGLPSGAWETALDGRVLASWRTPDGGYRRGPANEWWAEIFSRRARAGRRKVTKAHWERAWGDFGGLTDDQYVAVGKLDEDGVHSVGSVMFGAQEQSWGGHTWWEFYAHRIRVVPGELLLPLDWLREGLWRFVTRETVDFALITSVPGGRTGIEYGQKSPPQVIVPACRDVLRGYEWVMVVAPGIIEKLGGVEDVRQSGAFWRVEEVAGGAVWLQVTEHFEEFTPAKVRAMVDVLRPVLPARRLLAPVVDPSPLVLYDEQGHAPDPVDNYRAP